MPFKFWSQKKTLWSDLIFFWDPDHFCNLVEFQKWSRLEGNEEHVGTSFQSCKANYLGACKQRGYFKGLLSRVPFLAVSTGEAKVENSLLFEPLFMAETINDFDGVFIFREGAWFGHSLLDSPLDNGFLSWTGRFCAFLLHRLEGPTKNLNVKNTWEGQHQKSYVSTQHFGVGKKIWCTMSSNSGFRTEVRAT